MSRLVANDGSTAIHSNPPSPLAITSPIVATVVKAPFTRRARSVPGRSEMSAVLSGRNAMSQGLESPPCQIVRSTTGAVVSGGASGGVGVIAELSLHAPALATRATSVTTILHVRRHDVTRALTIRAGRV